MGAESRGPGQRRCDPLGSRSAQDSSIRGVKQEGRGPGRDRQAAGARRHPAGHSSPGPRLGLPPGGPLAPRSLTVTPRFPRTQEPQPAPHLGEKASEKRPWVTIVRLMAPLGGFLGGNDPLHPQAKNFSVVRGRRFRPTAPVTASAAGHSGSRAGRRRKPGHTGRCDSVAAGSRAPGRTSRARRGASGPHPRPQPPAARTRPLRPGHSPGPAPRLGRGTGATVLRAAEQPSSGVVTARRC